MRYGFTTGSCAAAAAKAAVYMLLTGKKKNSIQIETPKGIPYRAEILEISDEGTGMERSVSCAVRKDGGDDPDITTGALICAKVSFAPEDCRGISIDGGIGVGKVTKSGLDQPPGEAAINQIPREMIQREVREVCRFLDYSGGIQVEISVPDGERLAAQTFNPRLGITGGISILGTSGIVEPMSRQALLDTIRLELKQRRAEGFHYAAVSPGNYGVDFVQKHYGYDLDRSVKCSNFIGETIDIARELGFTDMLITGHIGKMIKVAGGIMNTHSREGDCRMELLAAFAVRAHTNPEKIRQLLDCVTTEEALKVLEEAGTRHAVMEYAMQRICYYLKKRSGGKIRMDCIIYANEFGELAKSEGAEAWFTLLAQEQARSI